MIILIGVTLDWFISGAKTEGVYMPVCSGITTLDKFASSYPLRSGTKKSVKTVASAVFDLENEVTTLNKLKKKLSLFRQSALKPHDWKKRRCKCIQSGFFVLSDTS